MICVLPQRLDVKNMAVKPIPEDQFFFARFNCYHAGAGYKELNIRLHFYIEPVKIVINPDTNEEEREVVKGWRDEKEVYFADADITHTDLDALQATRLNNIQMHNKKRKRKA